MPRTVSNKKDSRIGKTDRDIKWAMLELISIEPYSQIRVEQIMKEAPVTKVTFYKHFGSKDDVLDSIGDDMLSDMQARLDEMPENSKNLGGVELFYNYSNADNTAFRKLLNDCEYRSFAKKIRERFFASDFFREFCSKPEDFDIASGFISDVAFGVYKRWQKKPRDSRQDLKTLAGMTAHMLTEGLNGL